MSSNSNNTTKRWGRTEFHDVEVMVGTNTGIGGAPLPGQTSATAIDFTSEDEVNTSLGDLGDSGNEKGLAIKVEDDSDSDELKSLNQILMSKGKKRMLERPRSSSSSESDAFNAPLIRLRRRLSPSTSPSLSSAPSSTSSRSPHGPSPSASPHPSDHSSRSSSSPSPSSPRSSATPSPPPDSLHGDQPERRRSTVINFGNTFLRKFGNFTDRPGYAVIELDGLDPELAANKDMLSLPALIHCSDIHTVIARAFKKHNIPRGNIVLPVAYRNILRLKPVVITQIRRIRDQLKTSSDPLVADEDGECRHCSITQSIGHFTVRCASDPVALDGCFHCHGVQLHKSCCHRMSKANALFVSSSLARIQTERTAFAALSGEMFDLIELAHQFDDYLNQEPRPLYVNETLQSFVDIVCRDRGLEVVHLGLVQARELIGEENFTRETDEPEDRLMGRELDKRKEQSWSTREVIQEEAEVWATYSDVLVKISDIIVALGEHTPEELRGHPRARQLRQLLSMFWDDSALHVAFAKLEKARQYFGKPRQYEGQRV